MFPENDFDRDFNKRRAEFDRHLNGRVFETGGSGYLDLTRECPVYFMDVVRRSHKAMGDFLAKNPDINRAPDTLENWVGHYKVLEGHHFKGKFARFWDRVGVPIEEEPKPWDMGPCERCCLCRSHTRWWTKLPDRKPGEQVALCEGCALTTTPEAIPTKHAWCDKERELEPSFIGRPSPWAFRGKV